MIDINTAAVYWLCPDSADMRKGRDKLASIVRGKMNANPIHGENAFIFYSKDLHHDLTAMRCTSNGLTTEKFLKPMFSNINQKHSITKSQLMLFLTRAVQTTALLNLDFTL